MSTNHKEAFALMWYGCDCGHRERIWNSRDGVTPFCTLCPSCNRPDLRHVDWQRDECAPNHKPAHGQRVWVDMTLERAEHYVRQRIASARKQGHEISATKHFGAMVDNMMGKDHGGIAPDLIVTGYAAS